MDTDRPAGTVLPATEPVAVDSRSGIWRELKASVRLGGPLALGELGWMSTYIVDALMIGRLPASYSPLAQSASLLGNTIYYAIVFSAIYLLNGLETLVAQAYGKGRRDECMYMLAQAGWLVLALTPLVIAATLGCVALLPHFGISHEITVETGRYVRPLVLSTLPLMAYMALRSYLQSISNVVWVTITLVTAALVNWWGDWVFLLGHMGVRSMGVAGSAWGTLIVRVYMLAVLVIGAVIASRKLQLRPTAAMLRPDRARLRALLGIGWASGLENLAEFAVSTFQSVLSGRLGTVLAAAQDVVLNLNAFVYRIPVGFSYATVTRVGQAAGRDDHRGVRRAAHVTLALMFGTMTVAGLLFAVFGRFWAGLYSNNAQVVAAAAPIFVLCAFLLLGDTVFSILASALTGLGDTRTPMVVSLVWNWGIGMPLAYVLMVHHGAALRGLWIGRTVASVGTGLTLFVLWRLRMRRTGENLDLLRTLPSTHGLLSSQLPATASSGV